MRSTFAGLEMMRTALWANQRAMETTAHNIANAHTPGYARQIPHFTTPPPHTVPGMNGVMQMGAGVLVERIEQMRDAFAERQMQLAAADHEAWVLRQQLFQQIEALLNEPTEAGLQAVIDRWWDAVSAVANDPESMAARTNWIEQSQTLIAAFQGLDERLETIAQELTKELAARVDGVNDLAAGIDALNRRIIQAEADGSMANDLRDQRQRLLEQLNRELGVLAYEGANGRLYVMLGGTALVGDFGARALALDDVDGRPALVWAGDGELGPAQVQRGGIAAALALIDPEHGDLADMRAGLAELAKTLSERINHLHRQGYGLLDDPAAAPPGRDFFEAQAEFDLRNWRLSADLVADPRNIAVSATGASGDSDIAHAMLRYQQTGAVDGGPAGVTLDDRYRAWIGRIGARAQEAQYMADNQTLLVQQIEQQRQQASGVSIDEEMTKMLQYRSAYNAAARMLTTIDQMLQTLIGGTGLVGR